MGQWKVRDRVRLVLAQVQVRISVSVRLGLDQLRVNLAQGWLALGQDQGQVGATVRVKVKFAVYLLHLFRFYQAYCTLVVCNCYITGGALISFLISRSTGVSIATAFGFRFWVWFQVQGFRSCYKDLMPIQFCHPCHLTNPINRNLMTAK